VGNAALKTEPKGELLPIIQIAKRVNLHRSVVATRLEDLGYEPDETSTVKNKLYLFNDEMQFELKAAKDEAGAMKIRAMRADAQLKELKLARERGTVVEASEMVEIVQKIVGYIFQELTIRQIKRIGTKLAKAKNVTEIKKILGSDNSRIMKDLRANFERYLA